MISFETPVLDPQLHEVSFPNKLRHDGLAETYMDMSGRLYLAPNVSEQHDFAFSARLAADAHSTGTVAARGGAAWGICYNERTDLITMPAVLNSSLLLEEGAHDVHDILDRTAVALTRMKKDYGMVPGVTTIDALAIDRMSGKIEFLPPYHTQSWTVSQVLQRIRHDALSRATRPEEISVLEQCFAAALNRVRD